jgi:DNA-binding PadR family transcriptional regulator
MRAVAATSTFAILGLLSIAPMSGYDLARAAERSISYFWPISKTHVYSELARLEELGWAEGDQVRQEGLPDKRVFHITIAGERALDQWLLDGKTPDDQYRSPFLIKLFIGHRVPRSRINEMIEEYRDGAEAERRALEQIVGALEAEPKAAYPRAGALLGLRMAEAAVRWAEEVQATLPTRRITVDPRRKEARKARELFEAAPPPPSRRGKKR